LPSELKGALATVAISIQGRPTPALLKRLGLPQDSVLYGVFEGWDLRSLPVGEPRLGADRVILFEECLRRDFPGAKDLEREIRVTLIHELGHFFGFTEKELKARGWD
jgi:predicted Zn-dependent protease with MMP-like domain